MRIVRQPDTIVDPLAMMVKLTGAAIARSTVLASVEDVSVAHIAVQADVFFEKLDHFGLLPLHAGLRGFYV